MKKILVVLFSLFIFQNAYCDSILETDIKSDIFSYLDNKMDESAIRALCDKLLDYAWMHSFNIMLEYKPNKFYTPKSSDCKDSSINLVSFIVEGASVQTFEKHSDCVQKEMQRIALSNCDGEFSNYVSRLKDYGWVFNHDDAVVYCSETDNRCVVNRPVSRNGSNGYLSTCCSIPILSCEERNYGDDSFDNVTRGIFGLHSRDIVDNARTLNDFDYGCEAISK